jgi:hypothetical protein
MQNLQILPISMWRGRGNLEATQRDWWSQNAFELATLCLLFLDLRLVSYICQYCRGIEQFYLKGVKMEEEFSKWLQYCFTASVKRLLSTSTGSERAPTILNSNITTNWFHNLICKIERPPRCVSNQSSDSTNWKLTHFCCVEPLGPVGTSDLLTSKVVSTLPSILLNESSLGVTKHWNTNIANFLLCFE